ncbi:MAG: hypothetical protein IKB81_00375 [Paludibacteraceae bacterium]|nr:hypothetical protein [Paludibacteraceae bacterium]
MVFAILFSVLTTFSDGMFHTQYETEVSASAEACNVVIDSMIYYLQTDPAKLSEQFFAGLGKQEDTKKNAFYLVWKASEYQPEEQYSKLVLDVLVNERPFLSDVVIESQVTDSMRGEQRDIRVDIHYAGTLIKEAYGTFHVLSMGEKSAKIGMDVHVKFGWFFRMFISRKVYSETIDWRLVRFVTNLKLRAEGIVVDDAYWSAVDKQPSL